MNPSRRKRIKVTDAKEIGRADFAITLHQVIKVDAASHSCLVSLMPNHAQDDASSNPVCMWSLPGNMDINGLVSALTKWKVESTHVLAGDLGSSYGDVVPGLVKGMISVGAFEGVDPQGDAGDYFVEDIGKPDEMEALEKLAAHGLVSKRVTGVGMSAWHLTLKGMSSFKCGLALTAPERILSHRPDVLANCPSKLTTFELMQILDERGWALRALGFGQRKPKAANVPYQRGGPTTWYARCGKGHVVSRGYLWLLYQAQSTDGIVVPHLEDAKTYDKIASVLPSNMAIGCDPVLALEDAEDPSAHHAKRRRTRAVPTDDASPISSLSSLSPSESEANEGGEGNESGSGRDAAEVTPSSSRTSSSSSSSSSPPETEAKDKAEAENEEEVEDKADAEAEAEDKAEAQDKAEADGKRRKGRLVVPPSYYWGPEGGPSILFTFRPATASMPKAAWQVTCPFHARGEGTHCTRTVTMSEAAPSPEEMRIVDRKLRWWIVNAFTGGDDKDAHQGWMRRRHLLDIPDDAIPSDDALAAMRDNLWESFELEGEGIWR